MKISRTFPGLFQDMQTEFQNNLHFVSYHIQAQYRLYAIINILLDEDFTVKSLNPEFIPICTNYYSLSFTLLCWNTVTFTTRRHSLQFFQDISRTYTKIQCFSRTFQDWKLKLTFSRTFQEFQDAYER